MHSPPPRHPHSSKLPVQVEIMARMFTEEEIKQITNNFRNDLGGGSFGHVYQGQLSDGRLVAVKRIKIQGKNDDSKWRHEKLMLETFSEHRYFIQYMGYGVNKLGTEGYLVMQWLSMSLRDIVNFEDEVTELRHLTEVLAQIANAMDHIHQTKFGTDRSTYVYGDMKPDNVMLQKTNEGYQVKLIDLGSISKAGDQNFTYTNGYAAPEIFRGSRLSVKTDVYCLGMIMIDLFTRESTTNKERAAEENRAKKDKSKNRDAANEKLIKAQYMMHQHDHMFSKWFKVRSRADLESMKAISDIALDCTKRAGDQRPDMTEVERRLRELR
uniref:Protein kinase domain-containing protein n=1 Tax=Kalanchoe fedtschenkoi TaxID=63787 RepID=A0A7N0TJG1_KALFE